MTSFGPSANPYLGQGRALLSQGKTQEAIAALRQAVEQDPQNVDCRLALSHALIQSAGHRDALDHLAHARANAPDDERVYVMLGMANIQAGETETALEMYERALEINPSSMSTLRSLADLRRLRGEFREAYDLLKPFMDSGDADMYVMLSFAMVAHRFEGIEASIEIAAEVASYEGVEPHFIWNAAFMLGGFLDTAKRYDEAFAAYAQANALRRRSFDVEEPVERFAKIAEIWTEDVASSIPDSGNQSELPVFVVGMPRSGTTLVERIIGAHPDAFPAGERQEITSVAQQINNAHGNFLLEPAVLGAVDLAAHAIAVRDAFAALAPGASRFVDKMPTNALRLPLIAKLFPKSKVIRMKRDPRDTCLSCFFHAFTGVHPYTFDLRDLGRYYTAYEALTSRFCEVLELDVLEVEYESVVADQERVSREIIEFIGLPWHDDCLRFHEMQAAAITSSNEQVRRKVYSSSAGRWKNYENHLGPLFEALGDAQPSG